MRQEQLPVKTISELLQWSPGARCMLKLAKRARPTTLVLHCHDFKGGYGDDRFTQGTHCNESYTFQYWHLIDYFVYFSHYRVTIPPTPWIQASHKNGVSCFGTIITEWKEGVSETLELIYGPTYDPLLPSTQIDFSTIYADKLVEVAVAVGFDGWLLNIESPLPSSIHVKVLTRFLSYFRARLAETGLLLFWYDSVIQNGQVCWQNQLNDQNKLFFDCTDGFFTNYSWSEQQPSSSSLNAGSRKADVFTGIDVWGRGSFGGGGFNCHKALRAINEATSVAIFAPGWTFEYLDPAYFRENEDRFWENKYAPIHSLGKPIPLDKNDVGSVSSYIRPRPAPSTTGFYTNFDTGYGTLYFIEGKCVFKGPWTHISRQSIPPTFSLELSKRQIVLGGQDYLNCAISQKEAWNGGSCLFFNFLLANSQIYEIPLYKLETMIDSIGSLEIVYKSSVSFEIVYHLSYKKQSTVFEAREGFEKVRVPIQSGKVTYLAILLPKSEGSISIGSISILTRPDKVIPPLKNKVNVTETKVDWSGIMKELDQEIEMAHIFSNDEWLGVSYDGHFFLEKQPTSNIRVEVYSPFFEQIAVLTE